jgi:hypothetical protein
MLTEVIDGFFWNYHPGSLDALLEIAALGDDAYEEVMKSPVWGDVLTRNAACYKVHDLPQITLLREDREVITGSDMKIEGEVGIGDLIMRDNIEVEGLCTCCLRLIPMAASETGSVLVDRSHICNKCYTKAKYIGNYMFKYHYEDYIRHFTSPIIGYTKTIDMAGIKQLFAKHAKTWMRMTLFAPGQFVSQIHNMFMLDYISIVFTNPPSEYIGHCGCNFTHSLCYLVYVSSMVFLDIVLPAIDAFYDDIRSDTIRRHLKKAVKFYMFLTTYMPSIISYLQFDIKHHAIKSDVLTIRDLYEWLCRLLFSNSENIYTIQHVYTKVERTDPTGLTSECRQLHTVMQEFRTRYRQNMRRALDIYDNSLYDVYLELRGGRGAKLSI